IITGFTSSDYDTLIKAHPEARLKYLDEDEDEVIVSPPPLFPCQLNCRTDGRPRSAHRPNSSTASTSSQLHHFHTTPPLLASPSGSIFSSLALAPFRFPRGPKQQRKSRGRCLKDSNETW